MDLKKIVLDGRDIKEFDKIHLSRYPTRERHPYTPGEGVLLGEIIDPLVYKNYYELLKDFVRNRYALKLRFGFGHKRTSRSVNSLMRNGKIGEEQLFDLVNAIAFEQKLEENGIVTLIFSNHHIGKPMRVCFGRGDEGITSVKVVSPKSYWDLLTLLNFKEGGDVIFGLY